MASVLRRCLDCDRTFSETSQCPGCGSAKSILIEREDASLGAGPWRGAAVLILQALLVTIATRQAPGLVLGTFLFANTLCSVLLLIGIDNMPRVTRTAAAMSVVIFVAQTAITGQALLFVPAALMVVIGILLLYQDSTAGWLRPTWWLGIAIGALIAALTIAAYTGRTLPGWWQGRYLFKDREITLPSVDQTAPPALPLNRQP